jgi:hypothetical protein
MKITNVLNLPEGFVRAVTTERHNAAGSLSATTLLNGTKQIVLTERHWDEIEDDAADRIWATFGTAVHALMEHEGAHDFTEETLKCEVNGITVTGKIDNYNMHDEIITDYKTASVYKIMCGDFANWRLQGLIYAWLLARNGFPISKCRFVALLKDHSKAEAARNSSYPRKPVYIYEFGVSADDIRTIEDFVTAKILDYRAACELPDGEIPPCTAEERWQKQNKYAVIKEGRERAVRVFDTPEEAEKLAADLGKGHSVLHRPGESVRCMGYCVCKNFCNFYQDIRNEPVSE